MSTNRTLHALAGLALGGFLAFQLAACAKAAADVAAPVPGAQAAPSATRSMLEERWGIRIEGLRPSAGGYMLDFRYRVTDPEKARPLQDRNLQPSLVDLKSGARLYVPSSPKIGAMRSRSDQMLAGRVYFMLFKNPGQAVKRGDHVSIEAGDFRAENLTVE